MADYLIKNGENLADKLNELLRNHNGEECVIEIEEGRYFIDKTIELCNKKNVMIKGCGKVIFDGGIVIDKSEVTDYSGQIKMIDLKPYKLNIGEYGNRGFRRTYINSPNELFINGEPYSVSRYPKEGYIKYKDGDIIDSGSLVHDEEYDNRCAVVRLDTDRISEWEKEKEIYLAGYPNSAWADECIKIKSVNTEEKTVTTSQPHLFGYKVTGHSGWCVINLFCELSQPGEYYIDKDNEKLYFIPKGEITQIQLSVLDRVMIACENSENITIDGIIFENSRNTAIYVEGGERVSIKNCIFRNLGIMAIQIGQGAEPQPHGLNNCHGKRAEGIPVPKPISREMGSWNEYIYEFAAWDNNGGKNHIIDSCEIYNMGAGGILLSGGNRKKLIPGNNIVNNCELYQTNRLDKTYAPAIHVMGVGNTVSHCEIHDLPHMAINIHGNDHIVEYTKIYKVLTETSDAGAIYMGRDMSEVGNIFRYNFIYSIHNPHKTEFGVCAIYFDDSCIYNTVFGNYFYDIVSDGTNFFTPVYWTQGGQSSVANNIYIDCYPSTNPNIAYNAYEKMHTDPLSIMRVHTVDENDIHGVDITSEVYRKKYPYLYETYENDFAPGTAYWNNDVYMNQYSHFVDKDSLNFNFTSEQQAKRDEYLAPVKITDIIWGYEKQRIPYVKIDFDKIGRIK